MERLVDPILTDIYVEAEAAAAQGQQWARRRIRAAGAAALIKALVLYGWSHFWSFQEWPADDRRVLARTLTYAAAATAVAIPLLVIPNLLHLPASQAAPELTAYLVPQASPYSMAVGLFVGLLYGFRGRVVSLRPRAAVMLVGVLFSIASVVELAWIVPTANQAYRVAVWGNPSVGKGAPEMTLGELRTKLAANNASRPDMIGHAAQYHLRWALAAAPMVLMSWAFLVVAHLPNRRWVVGIVAIASCVAYYDLMWTGYSTVLRRMLSPIAGAWLPNSTFVVASLILLLRRTPNARTTNGTLSV